MEKLKKLIGGGIIFLAGITIIWWVSKKPNSSQPSYSISSSSKPSRTKTTSALRKDDYPKKIIIGLEIWKARDKEASLLIQETIRLIHSNYSTLQKIKALENLLESYQEVEKLLVELDRESETTPQLSANYLKLQELLTEWKAQQKSQLAEHKKGWFSSRPGKRWLTDREIDWALEFLDNQYLFSTLTSQTFIETRKHFKILPAYQFHYVVESQGEGLGFPELLSQLSEENLELVLIPVNNPDFHWSLLVYEVKERKFYHWDTLRGANDYYIKPLVKDLILQLWQINESDLAELAESEYLVPKYDIRQGNSHDCGVAVIEIAGKIMELWGRRGFDLNKNLDDFDFPKSRKEWRQRVKESLSE